MTLQHDSPGRMASEDLSRHFFVSALPFYFHLPALPYPSPPTAPHNEA